MLTYITPDHTDYPKRISANNLFYTDYKDLRPFFFHHSLIKQPMPGLSEALVPIIDDFKDKFSYITNDHVLNSIYFEYCDYYIKYMEDEEVNFAMLPINPYGPTGIGGRGLLEKWGPNHISEPIIITYDYSRNIKQLLVIEKKDTPGVYTLPCGMQDSCEYFSNTVTQQLKDKTNDILDIKNVTFIYSGYVNDSRNTDHAWVETSVYLFYLNDIQRKKLLKTINEDNNDNKKNSIKLINIDDENEIYIKLYSNHKEFVQIALNYIKN